MFRYGIGNCFGGFIAHSLCLGITSNDLSWGLKHIDSDWRNQLSMEHGANDRKYYCKSIFHYNLFRHRN